MKEIPVIITIRSRHSQGEEEQNSILNQTLPGILAAGDHGLFLHYEEPEDEGKKIRKNLIRINDSNLSVVGKGNCLSNLHFSHGEASKGIYKTPCGEIEFDIFTEKLEIFFQQAPSARTFYLRSENPAAKENLTRIRLLADQGKLREFLVSLIYTLSAGGLSFTRCRMEIKIVSTLLN